MLHQVAVHIVQVWHTIWCEERGRDPQHVAMTVEDRNISSRQTIMQVTDVAALRLGTIMVQTAEAHLLHRAKTKDIRRDFLDKLLPHADIKHRLCRTTGTNQGITTI